MFFQVYAFKSYYKIMATGPFAVPLCCWPIWYTAVCISQSSTPNLPLLPSLSPLATTSLFSMSLYACFCFVYTFICIIFWIPVMSLIVTSLTLIPVPSCLVHSCSRHPVRAWQPSLPIFKVTKWTHYFSLSLLCPPNLVLLSSFLTSSNYVFHLTLPFNLIVTPLIQIPNS